MVTFAGETTADRWCGDTASLWWSEVCTGEVSLADSPEFVVQAPGLILGEQQVDRFVGRVICPEIETLANLGSANHRQHGHNLLCGSPYCD